MRKGSWNEERDPRGKQVGIRYAFECESGKRRKMSCDGKGKVRGGLD